MPWQTKCKKCKSGPKPTDWIAYTKGGGRYGVCSDCKDEIQNQHRPLLFKSEGTWLIVDWEKNG